MCWCFNEIYLYFSSQILFLYKHYILEEYDKCISSIVINHTDSITSLIGGRSSSLPGLYYIDDLFSPLKTAAGIQDHQDHQTDDCRLALLGQVVEVPGHPA